jgi:hypothetical protein
MVRRRSCAVSNHELFRVAILRDAAERPLLRMRLRRVETPEIIVISSPLSAGDAPSTFRAEVRLNGPEKQK